MHQDNAKTEANRQTEQRNKAARRQIFAKVNISISLSHARKCSMMMNPIIIYESNIFHSGISRFRPTLQVTQLKMPDPNVFLFVSQNDLGQNNQGLNISESVTYGWTDNPKAILWTH